MTETDFLAAARGFAARRGPECTLGTLLVRLTSEQPALAGRIREALASDLTHAAIAKAFRSFEFEVNESTVGRHRRNECSNCPDRR